MAAPMMAWASSWSFFGNGIEVHDLSFLCVLGVLCGFLLGQTTTKSTKGTKESAGLSVLRGFSSASQIVRAAKSCYLSRMSRHRTITDREYARGLHILATDPANQSGADKTWVVHFLRRLEHFFKSARPVAKKRHGPVR